MSVFHFKKFDVVNESSAMKVNTDGVLLGAVAEVFPDDRNVLDVGTGTGAVALMICQRLSEISDSFHIQGIDIDLPSAEEAALNFRNSPWSGHIESLHTALADFTGDVPFDLVVSNPPYYDDSLMAPERRRNAARHTRAGEAGTAPMADTLSFREILDCSERLLATGGRISMILPADQEKLVLRHSRMRGFVLWRLMRIRTVPNKAFSRIIIQLKRRDFVPGAKDGLCPDFTEEELTLSKEKEKRASQQASLLTDYLL